MSDNTVDIPYRIQSSVLNQISTLLCQVMDMLSYHGYRFSCCTVPDLRYAMDVPYKDTILHSIEPGNLLPIHGDLLPRMKSILCCTIGIKCSRAGLKRLDI